MSEQGADESAGTVRVIRRVGGLPGGRAVVGAFLIMVTAVGVAAAHLTASAGPTTAYLVAGTTLEPGTRIDSLEHARASFGRVLLDLSPTVAARALPEDQLEGLVGRVVVAPVARGDLLTRTMLVDDGGVAPAQTLSFPIARTAAVGGALRPGERVDVVATYGSSEGSYTAYVVRGVPLLGLGSPEGDDLGARGEVTLTVAVSALEDVLALGHAVSTADVFVTRSTATAGDRRPAPGAYRAAPAPVGPVADMADASRLPTGPALDGGA